MLLRINGAVSHMAPALTYMLLSLLALIVLEPALFVSYRQQKKHSFCCITSLCCVDTV